MSFFEVSGLTKRFNGLAALEDVAFEVGEGEIVGLIGPNGAGKSTCFNVIAGAMKPTSGTIMFQGQGITSLAPHQIARAGIVRTFQQTSVFGGMSVRDNLRAASYLGQGQGVVAAALHTRGYRQEAVAIEAQVDGVLAFVGLAGVATRMAASLPFGLLRKLGIAIALAAKPRFLLMDEPAAGLNPSESAEFASLTRTIRASGVTVLLVEHDMKVIMSLCDRIVVLRSGRKLAEGRPAEIRAHPEVVESYLGHRPAAEVAIC